jgi:glycosyltransferase involved in cell wall biosynthesis
MTSPPELSVVIPAFNEERRIGPTLEAILAYLKGRGTTYEVLVADDGSSDDTVAVAETFSELGVRVLPAPENQGKGAATRRGVLASRGLRVLLTDADLSTPIDDLPRLEARLGEAAVVVGSRAVSESRVLEHQPLYRELMGKVFNRLIRLAGVHGIHDTQCGFKLLDGDAAHRVFAEMVTPGFAYDVELVWLARKLGFAVAEVGVTWVNSPDTRVRALTDPPRMLLEIARFRRRHRGRFG